MKKSHRYTYSIWIETWLSDIFLSACWTRDISGSNCFSFLPAFGLQFVVHWSFNQVIVCDLGSRGCGSFSPSEKTLFCPAGPLLWQRNTVEQYLLLLFWGNTLVLGTKHFNNSIMFMRRANILIVLMLLKLCICIISVLSTDISVLKSLCLNDKIGLLSLLSKTVFSCSRARTSSVKVQSYQNRQKPWIFKDSTKTWIMFHDSLFIQYLHMATTETVLPRKTTAVISANAQIFSPTSICRWRFLWRER